MEVAVMGLAEGLDIGGGLRARVESRINLGFEV